MKYEITRDTFLISDTHFNQKAALIKEPVRVKDALLHGFEDFDEFSLKMWNARVGADDKIWHLGDLYFGKPFKLLRRLNGRKLLIVGNNDIGKFEIMKSMKTWSVCDKLKLKIPEKALVKEALRKKFGENALSNPYLNAVITDFEGERIMFSHFPVFNRKARDRFVAARDILDFAFNAAQCSLNIHGHLHSKESGNDFCINISCEKLHFKPRKLGEILELYRKKMLDSESLEHWDFVKAKDSQNVENGDVQNGADSEISEFKQQDAAFENLDSENLNSQIDSQSAQTSTNTDKKGILSSIFGSKAQGSKWRLF